MLINKILVFGGLALGAILIVENMVTSMQAYVFVDPSGKAWFLSFISILIGSFIGYGIHGFLHKEKDDYNDGY